MARKKKFKGAEEVIEYCREFMLNNWADFNKSSITRKWGWEYCSLHKWVNGGRSVPEHVILPMVEFLMEKGLDIPFEIKQKLQVAQMVNIINTIHKQKSKRREGTERIFKAFDEMLSAMSGELKMSLINLLTPHGIDLVLEFLPHHFYFTAEYKKLVLGKGQIIDIFFEEI